MDDPIAVERAAAALPLPLAPPLLAPAASGPTLRADTQLEREFADLFAAYHARLVHFARRFVGRDVADDVVQDVFVSMWDNGGWASRDDEMRRRLLYRAVRNRIANANRGAFRERRRLARLWHEVVLPRIAAPSLTRAIEEDVLEQVEAVVRRMPARVREVWTLVRDHECTYAETAAIMDIEPQTVGAHIARANRMLRDALVLRGYSPATQPARLRAGRSA